MLEVVLAALSIFITYLVYAVPLTNLPFQFTTTLSSAFCCCCCCCCCSLSQYAFDPEGGWGAALAHHMQRRVRGKGGGQE